MNIPIEAITSDYYCRFVNGKLIIVDLKALYAA